MTPKRFYLCTVTDKGAYHPHTKYYTSHSEAQTEADRQNKQDTYMFRAVFVVEEG